MKILFFIHSLNAGGAERVLSLLVNEWVTYGHDVTIVTSKNVRFYKIDDAVRVILSNNDISAKYLNNPLTRNIKSISNYKNIMISEEPDVIISFMTTMNILTTIAAKLANKKIILSEHTNFDRLDSKLWRMMRRIFYPYSDKLVVLTNYDKNKYLFHRDVTVIENPIHIWNSDEKKIRQQVFLAVGRLNKVKGFDLLLEAFSRLSNINNWKLIILGEGPERKNLEKLCIDLNIDKYVEMPGNVTNIREYYYSAKIFVLSSRAEGFPVALCEAMSCGCVPISFDCMTGPREIISHNKNGLLVEAENVEQLASAMQSLMQDNASIEIMAQEAKKIKKRLDIELISRKWFDVIEGVVK